VSTYQILINGTAVGDDFYDAIGGLEVEENSTLPDALKLELPISTSNGDLTWVGDSQVAPYANIAVVATPDGGSAQCIFDGYVLSHTVHLNAGITASTVEVRAQDASVLMALDHQCREWAGMTEGTVANQIFSSYGFQNASGNTAHDSPVHDSPGHTLMQRGTDLEFLRRLARRAGRWCRVACTSTPGQHTGYFVVPDLTASTVATVVLNDPATASANALDFHWDVARPTQVLASQASMTDSDPSGVNADTDDSGLPLLDARGLSDFAGRDSSVRLTTPGDSSDLPGRAQAVLREAGWFTRCEGTAELSRIKAVLRVGTVVSVAGCGNVLSGNYLVSSVRHTIATNSHTMSFTLIRNAVGPPTAGTSPLASAAAGVTS
jgi:phage protein D